MKLRDDREVLLRPAHIADANGLQALEAAIVTADEGVVIEIEDIRPTAAVRSRIQRFIDSDNLLLIALIGDQVVGSVDVEPIPLAPLQHNAELTMGVLPSAQGVGLGRILLEAAMSWCELMRIDRIELQTLANNHRAIKLYESIGFSCVHLRKGFVRRADGRVIDDWRMEWVRG